jgi:hypothetical protein
MARRKKGSDLAVVEAIAGLIAVCFALVYLKDPAAGGALFQVAPWLILTLAVVGVGVLLVFGLVSRISVPNAGARNEVPDAFATRVGAAFPEVARPTFPKIEADRVRERVLSLEEKLDRLDWFQFEKVVAMLYSSRGCQVERRGGARPDGGIDLVVQSGQSGDGRFAVQCKFWKSYEVGVRQVRELMGALQDAGIAKGVIVSMKGFTGPARELACRNGIELLGKSALVQMLHEARFTPHIRELKAIMESEEKHCPRCERLMVLRTSRRDGTKFWGCSDYPRCRSTMDVGKSG